MADKTDGVLAVFDADIERQRIGVAAGRCDPDAMAEFEDARAKVAELLAAVEESRAATRAFANDGQPANWIRYEASETRIEDAIRAMRGEPPVG